MLAVHDLVGKAGREALRQERLLRLQKRAVPFLRRHFAPAVAPRSDAELMQAAGDAVPRAEARGFASESDIFAYLIPVTLLGHRFETDPQYHDMLTDAGWMSQPRPALQPLLALIDEHLDAVGHDDADLEARSDSFAALYRQNPKATDPESVHRWLVAIWPARAHWVGKDGMRHLSHALHDRMAGMNLTAVDAIALCALSFRLGHGCLDDPLCGWLTKAVARFADGPEAGREALGRAIFDEIATRQGGVAA